MASEACLRGKCHSVAKLCYPCKSKKNTERHNALRPYFAFEAVTKKKTGREIPPRLQASFVTNYRGLPVVTVQAAP